MSKIIVIDAGHGLKTAGKRCLKSIDPAQTREWQLNDRIADIVESSLREKYDCKVLRADDTTGAKDISLAARVKTANNAKADIYVSIHHNAGINGGSGGGTVVYHYAGAAREQQATRLYNAVTAKTGLTGNRSRHVIKYGYYVLKHTSMPALLIENGFMDSWTDTPVILSQDHAIKTAQGILDFLEKEMGLKAKASAPDNKPAESASKYFPAYSGAKTTLSAAMAALHLQNSYAYRKTVAKANNIAGYVGTAAQNTQMYNLLVAGLLIRP